jgi:integrase
MPTQITDATISGAIKRSKAGAFEANITDSKCPGLTLRITSSGTPTWQLRYRIGGKRKNITIGQYPVWGIAEAREKARALRRAVDEGVDVGLEKQRRKLEQMKAHTVDDVARHYFALASKEITKATLEARQSVYRKYIAPIYAKIPVTDIKPSDVAATVKSSAPGGQSVPAKVTVTWGLLFKVAIGMGLVGVDPSRDISTQAVVGKADPHRERVALTDKELAAFLPALANIPRHYELGIRLLLLTGCRIAQLTEASATEFDLAQGVWSIPHEHRKNRRYTSGPHEIPLPNRAVDWIRELLTMADRNGCLYSIRKQKNNRDRTTGKTGRGAFAHWLDHLWESDGQWRRITPHDIRATTKSTLSELRIDAEVRDRYLDHSPTGVNKTYDKAKLTPELRIASERLLAHYTQLETGESAKVIRMA